MSSVSHELIAVIPNLRRFARALCGNQRSADAYISNALEALLGAPEHLAEFTSTRLALYTTFVRLWNERPVVRLPIPHAGHSPSDGVDFNLQTLPSIYRQAFLLVAMEGFTMGEAAQILGRTPTDMEFLVDEARKRIMARIATDVLIIEDQALVALDFGDLVTRMGHRVIGIAANHRDAVALASKRAPGLVLADVKLADGSSGLDAVNEMLARITVPIIFVTGFPEMLLRARPQDSHLLAKPIDPAALEATITQALFFRENASPLH
jgi:DNA-directed RNA polymerase specialized sigma24 family protein